MNMWTNTTTGTASYTTGGFTITTTLSTLTSFDVNPSVLGANLGQSVFDITLNSPGAGQATVKVLQFTTDRLTSIGSITSLPAGVSLQATSGGTYSTVSHTHGIDHDHAVTAASTGPAGANAGTVALPVQPAFTTHTHTLNLANLIGTSGAEAAHTHTWNNIYQHQHSLTNSVTSFTGTELANATDLSGTTFDFIATD